MESQQALLARAHLSILKHRVLSLRDELEVALNEKEALNKELEFFKIKWNSLESECKKRREELDTRYEEENQEFKRQIKLAEEVLERKEEERKALLNYLYESNICEKTPSDLRQFDWPILTKMAAEEQGMGLLEGQRQKASVLASVNQKARSRLSEMYDLFVSTVDSKNKTMSKMNEIKEYMKTWKETNIEQEKVIAKMQTENERLNLLIKQCALSDEPISESVTRNVRDKCHSFLNSTCQEDLLSGLKKYKMRQDNMIKLLKHKENKLARDTNLLEVARDQTADQMQYYLNIIQSTRDENMISGLPDK